MRTFTVRDLERRLEAYLAWLEQTSLNPISAEKAALVDRLVAGE
jgi:hypothetical protein